MATAPCVEPTIAEECAAVFKARIFAAPLMHSLPRTDASHDAGPALQEAVQSAAKERTPFSIAGGGSKNFYGRSSKGMRLDVTPHCGIVAYEPSELVITARAGTPLQTLETALAACGQMLPFEPPHFGASATLGGTLACGLSGPRRPFAGAARDFVLGVKLINGRGEMLRYGGQVIKNVAGYDVSRLMVGALGTLGILLEVSLKVLPKPVCEMTLMRATDMESALREMASLGTAAPFSAACYDGAHVYLRLSGAESALRTLRRKIAGEELADAADFWTSVREHTHAFFTDGELLWRLSVPAVTPTLPLPGTWFIDWGGSQRWLKTQASAEVIREAAEQAGGHATLFRGGDRDGSVFHPLPPTLMNLHQRLKAAFDPYQLFNPGRLYDGL